MKCRACEDRRHWDCGMQTWCECDCDGEAIDYWGTPDDDIPHSLTCACETCVQDYPERLVLLGIYYDDDDDEE